jgi:hypothetical protein
VDYDTMYWHPAALGVKGEDKGYVVFRMEDWDRLKAEGGVGAKL